MPNRKILKMSLAANTNVTIFVSTNVSNALPLLSYNGGPRVPLLDALGDSGAKRKLANGIYILRVIADRDPNIQPADATIKATVKGRDGGEVSVSITMDDNGEALLRLDFIMTNGVVS